MTKIFLVEDDINFGTVLKSYLEMNNYQITLVDDGANAIDVFTKSEFDLCVLDVMLPNVDGFTIATEIRKLNEYIPLIFLTAKTLKEDIMRGYKVGADDYITKPFDSELLLYKIKAILKRDKTKTENPDNKENIIIGSFLFNYPKRYLIIGENNQKLSPKEAELLYLLSINKNKIVSREVALKKIWGDDSYFTTRSMDVYITKLRKYLKADKAVEINNIHGSGFILIDN